MDEIAERASKVPVGRRLLGGTALAATGAALVAFAIGVLQLQGQAQDASLRRAKARQKSALLERNRIEEAAAVDGRLVIKPKAPEAVARTLDGLARRAPVVLYGTFGAGRSMLADNDIVASEYDFTIDEVLKTEVTSLQAGTSVTVLMPGGRVSFENGAYAEVVPLFLLPLKGERFVVFLRPDRQTGGIVFRPLYPSWSLYQLGAKGTVIPHSAGTGVARTVHGMGNDDFLRLVREKVKG